ncbi:MAG: PilZ domain-containing protein [Myxococcota bacterium]
MGQASSTVPDAAELVRGEETVARREADLASRTDQLGARLREVEALRARALETLDTLRTGPRGGDAEKLHSVIKGARSPELLPVEHVERALVLRAQALAARTEAAGVLSDALAAWELEIANLERQARDALKQAETMVPPVVVEPPRKAVITDEPPPRPARADKPKKAVVSDEPPPRPAPKPADKNKVVISDEPPPKPARAETRKAVVSDEPPPRAAPVVEAAPRLTLAPPRRALISDDDILPAPPRPPARAQPAPPPPAKPPEPVVDSAATEPNLGSWSVVVDLNAPGPAPSPAREERSAPPAITDVPKPPRARLRVQITDTSESNFFTGFSGGLSDGGIFVASYDVTHPAGTEVELSLDLPDQPELVLHGVVRWIRDGAAGMAPGMGVELKDVRSAQAEVMREFMGQREPLFFER